MSTPERTPEAPAESGYVSQTNSELDELARMFYDRGADPPGSEDQPPPKDPAASEGRPPADSASSVAVAEEVEERSEVSDAAPSDEAPEQEAAPSEEEQTAEEEAVEVFEPGDGEDPNFEVTVNGESLVVPLSELRAGYQKGADYAQKTTALAEQRREFEDARSQEAMRLHQVGQEINQLVETLQFQMQRFGPSVQELEQLRQDDPGEYAARVHELRQTYGMIEQAKAVQQQREREAIAARAPQERQLLIERLDADGVDDYKNDFNAAYENLGKWALDPEGGMLSREEWAETADHRLVRLLHLAKVGQAVLRARDTGKESQKRVKRKLADLPRVRSGATPQGETQSDADRAMDRLKESGGMDRDAAAEWFLAKSRQR